MASMPVYAERPDKGTTIQNPSVALLCVDSYDVYQERFGNQSIGQLEGNPYNLLIYKKQALAVGAISRLALTEVNFNWAVPTINDRCKKLQIVVITTDGVTTFPNIISITVPVGWYNFTDLATAIQTELNANLGALTGTFTVTVDTVTFFFTITYLVGAGPQETAGAVISVDAGVGGDLSLMLGFAAKVSDQPVQFGTVSTSIEGNFPRLTYTPYIDIVSQRLTKNQHIYDNSTSSFTPIRSLLTRIYLSNNGLDCRPDEDFVVGTRPFTLKELYNFPKQISWEPTENIDSIDLIVLDWNGEVLYSTEPTRVTTPAAPPPYTIVAESVGNAATFQFTLQLSEN